MHYNDFFVFQDNTTVPNTGNVLTLGENNQVTVYITGTSTTHNITFDGCDAEGNWFNGMTLGVKLPDLTLAGSTTGTNEAWVIDTSSWVKIRINVTAISNGYIRATGKVVNV